MLARLTPSQGGDLRHRVLGRREHLPGDLGFVMRRLRPPAALRSPEIDSVDAAILIGVTACLEVGMAAGDERASPWHGSSDERPRRPGALDPDQRAAARSDRRFRSPWRTGAHGRRVPGSAVEPAVQVRSDDS